MRLFYCTFGYDAFNQPVENIVTRIVALISTLALLCGPAVAQEPAAVVQELQMGESGLSAPAQPTYSLDGSQKRVRLDFDFREGESRAWLNQDGDLQVQGWIKHRGLLCATYRMGVRFGSGAPACQNLTWLTEPIYLTSQLQCNGARVSHLGSDNLPALASQLDRITCAERVILCTGNCR